MNEILNEVAIATFFSVVILALMFCAAITICITLASPNSKDGEE